MDDDGMYKCVAKNPRGETDGTIRLYGKFKSIQPKKRQTNEKTERKKKTNLL